MLEATHPKKITATKGRLRVFYGFSKINKIQKREAIQISFENEEGAGWEENRSGKTLRKLMNIVTERYQTPQEAQDAKSCNRMFTTYYIFLDDKRIDGSLEKALVANMEADSKNVSPKELNSIKEKLKAFYLNSHPEYKEPNRQLQLQFDDG